MIGIYSPPQTPNSNIDKTDPLEIPRPETPPPSTHRHEAPVSPETPTHPSLHDGDRVGGATLFDDKAHLSQPSTPVLYHLIRNEGPPKFVIASPTSENPKDVNENVDATESMFLKYSANI